MVGWARGGVTLVYWSPLHLHNSNPLPYIDHKETNITIACQTTACRYIATLCRWNATGLKPAVIKQKAKKHSRKIHNTLKHLKHLPSAALIFLVPVWWLISFFKALDTHSLNGFCWKFDSPLHLFRSSMNWSEGTTFAGSLDRSSLDILIFMLCPSRLARLDMAALWWFGWASKKMKRPLTKPVDGGKCSPANLPKTPLCASVISNVWGSSGVLSFPGF